MARSKKQEARSNKWLILCEMILAARFPITRFGGRKQALQHGARLMTVSYRSLTLAAPICAAPTRQPLSQHGFPDGRIGAARVTERTANCRYRKKGSRRRCHKKSKKKQTN